jgi:hypothetical protein
VDTATSVQDLALRDGTFDGPTSALTGLQVIDASDLDAVLDALPPVGTFEVRPVA